LDPDSALTVVRFEGHAQRAIEVLRECFRTDSTVQDLPAAVGWFLHNPVMTGIECNGVIPFYEGVPRLVVEVGCEYPDVEHAPSGSFTVWIETVIDRNGDVRLARVKQVGTRPIPMLEEGALACVRRRRYHPASFEGHPFGFRLTVPVTYKFE
jgi:hypothetical protein